MPGSAKRLHQVVGSRELKTRLGKYLRAVVDGAVITVTDRGIPVARLSALPESKDGIDAILAELEADGVISRGSGRSVERIRPAVLEGESIDHTIVRNRCDRF